MALVDCFESLSMLAPRLERTASRYVCVRTSFPNRMARLGSGHALSVVTSRRFWRPSTNCSQQAGDLTGKVIISCSLPMDANDTALAVAHRSSGAETLARKVRKAEVVSAFSTVPSEVLFEVFDAKR